MVCSSVGGVQLTETQWPETAFLSWYLHWDLKDDKTWEEQLQGGEEAGMDAEEESRREARVARAQVEEEAGPNTAWRPQGI